MRPDRATRLPLDAALIGVLLVACGDPAPPTPAPIPAQALGPRPSFLLVTLDTTRADALSPYGGPPNATPMIGQIAAEGVRFDRAYTVTPLTIPAHSSLHTGLLPPRHGVRDNGDAFLSPAANTLAERLRGAGYRTMASVGAEVTSHHWGFDQGFEAFFDDLAPVATGDRWRAERPAGDVVDDALGWLQPTLASKEPFFAWVHVFDAHHPYAPPPPFDSDYEKRPYLGELAYIDSQLSRLYGALQLAGALESTWIILVADHGEGMGDHGEGTHGLLLYDATTRIPLIIRPPGGGGGAPVAAAVSMVDLAPTVLAAAGIPVEDTLDGVNLLPLMAGEQPAAERSVYVESLYGWRHFGFAPQRALVDSQHKLIDSTTPEVYRGKDGGDAVNLAPTEPALTQGLLARMDSLAAGLLPLVELAGDVNLDADRAAQLVALGYVVGDATAAGADTAPFRGALPDPNPADPTLNAAERARALIRDGQPEAALEIVNSALERNPKQGDLLRTRVDLLTAVGRRDEALAEAQRLDAEAPTSQLKLSLAELAFQRGDPEEGERMIRAALAIDPYLAVAWRRLLHQRFMVGDLPRLAAAVKEAELSVPEDPTLPVMQGVLAMGQRDLPRAERLLREGIARDPSQPFAQLHLGLVKQQQGDLFAAETALREELRRFPKSLPARVALVEITASQRRWGDQLTEVEGVLAMELTPTRMSLQAKAQALFNLGRYPEADVAVDACIEADARASGCALLKANTLSKLGRKDEALAQFERAKVLHAAEKADAAAAGPARPR